ncbi:MAG TPA: tyrosine decarboxylase MfnA [Methanoculleus sp.]|nr:tyrosine decarboxylase MfnA [Methanoculleus sp.]
MRTTGCPEEKILSFLSSQKAKDRCYRKVLSSMCTLPHPLAVRVQEMFIESNLGDPGLFEGTAEIEALLIEELGSLLHLSGPCGYATSGGTESNIQALRIARKAKPVASPNVVVPESAHFSFEKACDLLGLEMRTVPSDSAYRMDADRAADCIDDQTIALVGIAGTTEYGVVDPIDRLAALAIEHDVHLHVDAAFGGLVLPFLTSSPAFDFRLEGVASVSVDPHKMGMSTIPVGCLLTREASMLCALNVDTPYLTVKKEFTLAGTRPGCAVVGAWAVLELLGRDGFSRLVQECMGRTRRLIEGMESYGYSVVVEPEVNVAAFDCPRIPPGWQVSRTRHGHMRIVCMPHVSTQTIENFLHDIGEMDV